MCCVLIVIDLGIIWFGLLDVILFGFLCLGLVVEVYD